MQEADPLDSLILTTLRNDFLCYVLNTDAESLSARLIEQKPLVQRQENALLVLKWVLTQINIEESNNDPGWHINLDVFGLRADLMPEYTWANYIRKLAGGRAPKTAESSTDFNQFMVSVATEMFPLMLLPRDGDRFDPFHPGFSRPMHHYLEQINRLIGLDDDIKQLFPDSDGALGRRGFVTTSTGRGGGIQTATFPEYLIKSAWELATLDISTAQKPQFIRAIRKVLVTLRQAIRGEEPLVPVRIGLAGIKFDGIQRIPAAGGVLRPSSPNDISWQLPAHLSGTTTNGMPDGSTVITTNSGDLVFETRLPLRIRIESGFPQPQNDQNFYYFHELDLQIESLQLGALLGLPVDSIRPKLKRTWIHGLDIFNPIANYSWTALPLRPTAPTVVANSTSDSFKYWSNRIYKHRTKHIDMAISRALSAELERADPKDSIVDTVVAWENLFGTKAETTFRLSAAIAILLKPRGPQRASLQKDVKNLYDIRSKLVHGNPDVDRVDVYAKSIECMDLTRSIFLAIFKSRLPILAIPESKDRNASLILNH